MSGVSVKKLVDTVDSFGNVIRKVGNAVDSLENTVGKVGNAVDSLENTVGKVVTLSESLAGKPEVSTDISEVNSQIVDKLRNTPGMTQSRGTKFKKATPIFKLKDGTIIKTYKNSVGVDHLFLGDSSGRMLFGGYVGWIHSDDLEATIAEIKRTFV
jgi:hypothetical protein